VAGVREPGVIDVVAQDADGTIVVAMVEDRPWGDDPEQERQLREKINTYAGFVLDGSLVRHYPETEGQPVRIQLDCVEEPTGRIAVVTDHAASELAKLNIGFTARVRG